MERENKGAFVVWMKLSMQSSSGILLAIQHLCAADSLDDESFCLYLCICMYVHSFHDTPFIWIDSMTIACTGSLARAIYLDWSHKVGVPAETPSARMS